MHWCHWQFTMNAFFQVWVTLGIYVLGGLTHVYICISKLSMIGWYNGLLPGQRQAIIWPNTGILLIGTSGTNFSEIFIVSHTFSFKKMHLKMSSTKWRPCCQSFNMLSNFCLCKGTKCKPFYFLWFCWDKLTHCGLMGYSGLVTPYDSIELGQHCPR